MYKDTEKQYYIRRTGKQTGKLEAAVDKSSAQSAQKKENRRMQGSARNKNG